MQQVVIIEPGKIALQNVPEPVPEGDQVCLQVRASGLCGTDLHIYHGGFAPSYPVVPGHEFAGEVVAVGPDCQRIRPGMRVAVEPNVPCNNCEYCLRGQHHYCTDMEVSGVTAPGGMSEYTLVRERGVFDIGSLDYDVAAFVEPLSCVIHSQDRLRITQGDKILVIGAGPIGALHGVAASKRGAIAIDYVELDAARRSKVEQCDFVGKSFANLKSVGRHYNAVIDATGVSSVATDAIYKLLPQGRLLLFGVPEEGRCIELDHYYLFRKEIEVMGSFTSLKDSLRAIEFIHKYSTEISRLVSHQIALTDIVSIMAGDQILEGARKIMVRM